MKLCKDCKHAAIGFGLPALCGHPNAERDLVYGWTTVKCWDDRGKDGACGPDAKLFEEKPAPEPAPEAGSIVWVQAEPDRKLGWFARLFGWWS